MSVTRKELFKDFEDAETAYGYLEEFQNIYIATQIHTLRLQRELTQEALAKKAGMKQTRIHVLEDVNYDSWSIKTLRRLAEAFDLGLRVSFESIGTMVGDIVNMDENNLKRVSRKDEINARKRQTKPSQFESHTKLVESISDEVRTTYVEEKAITARPIGSAATRNKIRGNRGTEGGLLKSYGGASN